MATTNDVQEEEVPTTALERQVKTLATAVERLTKQNHDLEEQLKQKNAAPNNQGADQEGTNADRRNQEGPQASNAPSKPERQNISIPSLAETTPPLVIVEMQAMKEQMEVMMNALKGECPAILTTLSTGLTRHLRQPSTPSPCQVSSACHIWIVMTGSRTL